MKNLLLSIVILAFIIGLSQKPAHAQGDLETWCIAQGQIWDETLSKCTINGTAILNGVLTLITSEHIEINDGGTLVNNGTIENDGDITILPIGVIDNYGTFNGEIDNYGIIYNNGGYILSNEFLFNEGSIFNYIGGIIVNTNNVYNCSSCTLLNDGSIYNRQAFNNIGTITNNGVIANYAYFENNLAGILNNEGNIYNYLSFENNSGIINNDGFFNNYCPGFFVGNLPVGNPIVYFDYCAYIPLIER